MLRPAAAACAALLCGPLAITDGAVAQTARPDRQADRMKIRFVAAEGEIAAGTLSDNPTARDFAALLPLSLTLEDYAATEKIGDLPRRLASDGAPDGFEPKAGDIAFYAPWGNLAIFHKAFRYSPGLVRLGAVSSGVDRLARPGAVTVRIEGAD